MVSGASGVETDLDSAFYWEGLAARRLLLQRCAACGRHRFPPLPACPSCGGEETEIAESEGVGSLYSWVVVHRAFSESFADEVPYTVGVVELAEGCRVLARLELGDVPARLGLPLTVFFRDHAAGARAGWTEACFRPVVGGTEI